MQRGDANLMDRHPTLFSESVLRVTWSCNRRALVVSQDGEEEGAADSRYEGTWSIR